MLTPLPRHLVASGLVALGFACTSERSDSPRVRKFASVSWDTVWITGKAPAGEVHQPYTMTADESRIYVIDAPAELVALRSTDGSQVWRAGRRGSGPAEFTQVFWLSVSPAGEVVVLDRGKRRATLFDTAGAYSRSISLLRAQGNPEAFCPLPDGGFLVAVLGGDTVVDISPDAVPRRLLRRPWNITDPNGVANQVIMDRDHDTGTCVTGLMHGGGFSFYDGKNFTKPVRYIDDFDPPTYVTPDSLSHDLMGVWDMELRHDTLWVLFEGRSAMGKRLLDAYDYSGRYMETLLLPGSATQFARSGDTYVFRMDQEDGSRALVALRPRRKYVGN